MCVTAHPTLESEPAAAHRPKRFRSLASKFTIFTAGLVFWIVITILGYDLRQDSFDVSKGLLLCLVVLLVSAAIARFTIRLLAKPLSLLQAGITAVRNGQLAPIQVSKTGDEIEFVGESFNQMIEALAASHEEVRRQQELLEERIRQRTEQLQEITARAETASRVKSEFLANVSHELRTPMNGIIGMIDLVMEGGLSTEQRERLNTAQECAYSLLSLLNDILDLSKIEAGKMTLERIPFALRSLVEDCVRSHALAASQKEVELRCAIAPTLPGEIIGDPLRMRQILMNLLSNAVKFTSKGHILVRATGQQREPGVFIARFEVEDTGPGIPAGKLSSIFEKFTQADGSISRKYGGTGLGLAITRKLVEMYEGDISVQSEPGRGTTFTVNLKCGVAPGEAQCACESHPHSCVTGTPVETADAVATVKEPRILVVEDNHVNQKVVLAILRKRGFEIELANDGREALSKLESSAFDLILMDVQMPVMDGLEATRLIRSRREWKQLPIVAMTAHAMNGDRERCLEAGMSGYIAKPVHPAHLLQTIDEHLVAHSGSGANA